MVNRNHNHNAVMAPLWIARWTAPRCRFEPIEGQPGFVRQVLPLQPGQHGPLPTQEIYPFALREDFWQAKSDSEMLEFLNRAGVWWATAGSDSVMSLADVFKFQEFTRRAAAGTYPSWRRLPGGMEWANDAMRCLDAIACQPFKGGLSLQVYGHADLRRAILATLVIDKLAKNRFRLCKKPDCRMPFKIDIRGRKHYCSEAHRQAEAMRRYRSQKKSVKGE